MVALLNASYALRRLALLAFVFIACILVLRATTSSYNDYLPSWKSSTLYNPNSPDQDSYSESPVDQDAADRLSSAERIRPEDLISKPEDILPELQDIPAGFGSPGSDDESPTSSPRSRVSLDLQETLQWNPPVEVKDHYPPYDAYQNRDYDPNRWEDFEQNNGFYENGTTRKVSADRQYPTIYEVYPSYNTADWLERWRGEYVSCDGPSGIPYNKSTEDFVMSYGGLPKGFPQPDLGSFDAVGLDGNVCFDRFARLGPYGLNENTPDFRKVKWGQLQNECLERNKDRYKLSNIPTLAPGIDEVGGSPPKDDDLTHGVKPRAGEESLQYKPRTAVLIRTWDTYDYQENDIQAVRSLISELSLQSGGEYQIFLFVNIKDSNSPIFTDSAAYQKALEQYVPEELRDIAMLWSEKVCTEWYPKVGEWSVYFQQFMPLQWFAEKHPEFEYIWNWEMDARYIGHHYHFLEEIAAFSRLQPRKYLWERNSRYYFPAAHGSYDEFVRQTHEIVANSPYVETVWGAQPWSKDQKTSGPIPPSTEAADDFEWGIDEEADFITLLPMWDPRQTWWAYRDKLWGYPASDASTEERPFPHVPRRTFINTLSRFSSKLLRAMHEENKLGVSMASEMWPSSVALQHGLKAVYAPHPIWLSHHWPAEYLDQVFNADGWGAGSLPGTNIDDGHGVAYDASKERKGDAQTGTGPNGEGRAGRWSQERDSVYSPDREHNFGGWSWYFWSDFPKTLYWRWLGWPSSFNIVTIQGESSTDELKDVDWQEWEANHGRMCLPGMLLHPVKNVKPPPPEEKVEKEDEVEEEYEELEEESTAEASSESSKEGFTSSDDVPSAKDSEPHVDDGVTLDAASSFDTTSEAQASDSSSQASSFSNDNTPTTENHHLVDLPLDASRPQSPPSEHAVSLSDDKTLTEDTRFEDHPLHVSRPYGQPSTNNAVSSPAKEAELDTTITTTAFEPTTDAANTDAFEMGGFSTEEDTNTYRVATGPRTPPQNADFYGDIASQATSDVDASSDFIEDA